jgi:PIN domain nuclease of toxin-antitoxin system
MIILDTCILLYDALTPERLSAPARRAIEQADTDGSLACCDISLWEVAMLASRGRVVLGTDVASFLRLVLAARTIQVLPSPPRSRICPSTLDCTGIQPIG